MIGRTSRKVTIDWDEKENVEWQDYKPKKKNAEGKRHLLITTDNFLPRWDGISRFLSEIVPRLKDDYDITIACPDYGHVQIEGVTLEKIPISSRSFGDYVPATFQYKTIKKLVKKADIVFNQALGPIGFCAIIAARRCKRPIANYIHSVEWELFPKAFASPMFRGPFVAITKFLTRSLYNKCTMLIVPSENVAEQFSWQKISTPKRIAHLGVNTDKFSPGKKREVRKKLGLPEDAFIVGYHGRISHEKNLLTLVRGFRQLTAKNKKLLIVGDGVLELKSRLERSANVQVTGMSNNVVPWLQSMDIYVQSSLTETTSLSVLEAMACQLPVVSSKVGFIQYYLIDKQNGLFFDNRSGFDLALKLKELYKDKELREKIAANARKTIEKSFQWRNTAKVIKEVLDEI